MASIRLAENNWKILTIELTPELVLKIILGNIKSEWMCILEYVILKIVIKLMEDSTYLACSLHPSVFLIILHVAKNILLVVAELAGD